LAGLIFVVALVIVLRKEDQETPDEDVRQEDNQVIEPEIQE